MPPLMDYQQEIPEVEGFIDWLYEHSEFAEGPSQRILREALHKAYLKGQKDAAPQAVTGQTTGMPDEPRNPERGPAGAAPQVCRHYINGIHHTDRCYNCGHTLRDHQPARLG